MVVAINKTSVKTFKVVLLGDVAVGKSSVMASLKYGAFAETYQPTIAPDYFPHLVSGSDGSVTKLSVWDTAGQEKFRAIIPTFLRDISVCILVFDLTSRRTFENVRGWMEFVRQERGEDRLVHFYLVGNKADLTEERAVSKEEGAALSESLGCREYCEVSAKRCLGISELFTKVAQGVPLLTIPDAPYMRSHIKVDHRALHTDKSYTNCSC